MILNPYRFASLQTEWDVASSYKATIVGRNVYTEAGGGRARSTTSRNSGRFVFGIEMVQYGDSYNCFFAGIAALTNYGYFTIPGSKHWILYTRGGQSTSFYPDGQQFAPAVNPGSPTSETDIAYFDVNLDYGTMRYKKNNSAWSSVVVMPYFVPGDDYVIEAEGCSNVGNTIGYRLMTTATELAGHIPPGAVPWDGFKTPSTYSDAMQYLAPVSYYKLDELTGTTFADSSGNNHPATLEYMSNIEYNKAAVFGGSNRSIALGTSTQISGPDWLPNNYTGPWSIVCSINASTAQMPHNLVGRGRDYAGDGWSMGTCVFSNGAFGYAFIMGGAMYNGYSPAGIYPVGEDATIVTTFSGGALKLYCNGTLAFSVNIPNYPLRNSTTGVIIGGMNFDNFNKGGLLDEVGLFDYELTANMISFLYSKRNNL